MQLILLHTCPVITLFSMVEITVDPHNMLGAADDQHSICRIE